MPFRNRTYENCMDGMMVVTPGISEAELTSQYIRGHVRWPVQAKTMGGLQNIGGLKGNQHAA